MSVKKASSVEEYLKINSHFAEVIQLLRQIINSKESVETFKWIAPSYYLKKNVVALGAFKNHFSI